MTAEKAERAPSAMFGESGYERQANDLYQTPAWCTHALFDAWDFGSRPMIWEPAAGLGAMTSVMMDRGLACCSSDLIQYPDGPPGGGQDFLRFEAPPSEVVTAIVTNPPYILAVEFVEHALRLMKPVSGTVAMLLRHEWDCAAGRTHLFDRPPFACKLTLTRRPRWSDTDKAAPRFNFAWFIWSWCQIGPAALLYGPRPAGDTQHKLF